MTAKEQGLPGTPAWMAEVLRGAAGKLEASGQPYYWAHLRSIATYIETALASDTGERGVVTGGRTFSAYGYSDADRARIVSAMQSARDRMAALLPKAYGEGWDGDLDTMLEAINYMKRCRQNEAADFKSTGEIK